MTKRELSKRKNKSTIYTIYENNIEHAYSLAEAFSKDLQQLSELRDKYRTNTYMWELVDKVFHKVAGVWFMTAYNRCIMLKEDAYKVSLREYNLLANDIDKLSYARGKINSVISLINYLEENNLGIRSI